MYDFNRIKVKRMHGEKKKKKKEPAWKTISKNQLIRRFPYRYGNRLVTDEMHSKRDAPSVAHVPRYKAGLSQAEWCSYNISRKTEKKIFTYIKNLKNNVLYK